MMNILLIQPRFKNNEIAYPLGLSYISSVLKSAGHFVFGLDMSFCNVKDVRDFIQSKEIALTGISITSYNYSNALGVIDELGKDKSVPVVVGGPHATVMKGRIFDSAEVDFVIQGEGEFTMLELANSLEKGVDLHSIKGLIWKDVDKVVINAERDIIAPLDLLPFPDRDIFPILRYKGMLTRNDNYTQIITSRGCRQGCYYCPETAIFGSWRGRSFTDVVDEIQIIREKFGIREIHIEDANFFGGGLKRVRDICLEIKKRTLDVEWLCPNGLPLGEFEDLSIIDDMATAGCIAISLGVESFDSNITGNLGRMQDPALIKNIVKKCRAVGMEVTCYLIIAFPEQSFRAVIKDIYYSQRFAFDFIHYSIFHFIPGSKLYPESGNKIIPDNRFLIVQKLAYLSLLFNPAVIYYSVKRLFYIKNPLKVLKKFFYYLFGNRISL